ncbi:MAG: ribonuclease III [Planctomycetes bacterium]|nr:ribonuclease III [Planctomycetota bacterium]
MPGDAGVADGAAPDRDGMGGKRRRRGRRGGRGRRKDVEPQSGGDTRGDDIRTDDAITEAPTEEFPPLVTGRPTQAAPMPTATGAPGETGTPGETSGERSRQHRQQPSAPRATVRTSQRHSEYAPRRSEAPVQDLPLIPVDDDGWPTFDEPPGIPPRVIEETRHAGLFANLDAMDDAKTREDSANLPLVEPFDETLVGAFDEVAADQGPGRQAAASHAPVRGEDVRPEDEPPTEEFPALNAGAVGVETRGPAPIDRGASGDFREDPRGPRRGRRGRRGGARREGPIAQPPADPYATPTGPVAPARTVAPAASAGFDAGLDAGVDGGFDGGFDAGFGDSVGDDGASRPAHGHHDSPAADRDLGRGPAPRGPVSTPATAMQRSADRAALHFFRPERLEACQHAIKYHFRDITLLENALTHSSIKSDDRPSYERLEFLGDSVVGLIIAEHLYDLLPDCDEGEMTRLKSAVVSTDGLANAALEIGLEQYLAVGRGLMRKNEIPRSLIADVFEGVTGAVYLDRGYETAKLYVLDHLGPFVHRALSDHTAQNFKSVLQQVAQRDLGETPQYDAVREWGPEHTRQYEVVAVVGRRRFPAAHAPTKREAEQAAAKLALQVIMVERGAGNISPKRRHDRGPDSGRGPGRGSGRGPSRGSRGGPRRGPRGGSRGGPR